MELVYVYAGYLGKGIDNTGINFSKNFEVTYDREKTDLKIKKISPARETNIYGDNIQDINVIVGKNGVGKTTIMRLLGLPERDKNRYFRFYDDLDWANETKKRARSKKDRRPWEHEWLAVYHIKDDKFAIEGYWQSLLGGALKGFIVEVKPNYCMGIEYNFEKDKIEGAYPIRECDFGIKHHDDLFYVHFQNIIRTGWLSDYIPTDGIDDGRGDYFQRLSSSASKYESVLKYMADSYRDPDFSQRMGTKPGTTIRIKLLKTAGLDLAETTDTVIQTEASKKEIIKLDYEKEKSRLIYGSAGIKVICLYDKYTKNFDYYTDKESFILSCLETTVYKYYYEDHPWIDETNDYIANTPYTPTGDNDFKARCDYLLEALSNRKIRYDRPDWIAIDQILKGLSDIPDKYFIDSRQIEMQLSELSENILSELMRGLDQATILGAYLSHETIFRINISNMSAGEAHFIDLFASIHGALRNREQSRAERIQNNNKQTCVLLLDEPDMSFHPEWSRCFIKNLVDFLKTEGANYNFQVIIATHSPLMLSDIPSDSIYCLDKNDEGKLEVKRPSFGFLSGINDLLVDGFFTESVFGQFAEDYANDLIKQIEKLENALFAGKTDAASDEEEYQKILRRVNVLDEGIVRRSLLNRLERLHYWYRVRTGANYDKG
ncbi:MAG: hypothetical protein E7306_03935 [Butyrivibrio sp.]|nr:hypothetical protein [Butyrivibrio sp.]